MTSWRLLHSSVKNRCSSDSLNHITCCQSSISNVTIPGEVLMQCHGVNRSTLVGLLITYPIEAKECWIDLLEMCIYYFLHWMWMNRVSVTYFLPQVILAKYFWSRSLKTCDQPQHSLTPSIRYSQYTHNIHRSRDVNCPPNLKKTECPIHYHEQPLTNWYRSEYFYDKVHGHHLQLALHTVLSHDFSHVTI